MITTCHNLPAYSYNMIILNKKMLGLCIQYSVADYCSITLVNITSTLVIKVVYMYYDKDHIFLL